MLWKSFLKEHHTTAAPCSLIWYRYWNWYRYWLEEVPMILVLLLAAAAAAAVTEE